LKVYIEEQAVKKVNMATLLKVKQAAESKVDSVLHVFFPMFEVGLMFTCPDLE